MSIFTSSSRQQQLVNQELNSKMITTELKARFLSNVEIQSNGCWLWIGNRSKDGYGSILLWKKHRRAHRIAWLIFRGSIPFTKKVLHDCPTGDNPLCVNPDHLWLGTSKQNSEDMVRKGRQACGDRSGARLYPERRPRGEAHGRAKLTKVKVFNIRNEYKTGKGHGVTQYTLADKYDVSQHTIYLIVNGRIWKEA